jgi:hypothetical protein
VTSAAMKKYRSLLKATVREESRNRRTSKEIANIFQQRHRRAVAAVAPILVTAKIVKDIDDVTLLVPKSVDPRQGELFEEYKVIQVVSFPVIKDGKRVRTERRALLGLTFDELTQLIAYRQTRPARRSEPIDGYIQLHDEIAPYATPKTTVEVAYRAMRKAQKRA